MTWTALGRPAVGGRRGGPATAPVSTPVLRVSDLDLPTTAAASAMTVEAVALAVGTDPVLGLTSAEAVRRLAALGPNAVRDHRANALKVLTRQLKSPLLLLLAGTALVSAFAGDRADAIIIGVILTASVGLGFGNEFRAERATEALHDGVHHAATVIRDGTPRSVGVTDLVPGDVVGLGLGNIVPADVRLTVAEDFEADESVLTGESLPVAKSTEPVPADAEIGDLSSTALMGTVVHAGSGRGVVVATGARAEFGRIAAGLGQRHAETDFQTGLRRFSLLLLWIALVLTTTTMVTGILLHHGLSDSLLFALAIAVGITPQLLPAVVSAGLATGSRQLAKRKVLVKRLVSIEDLGDMDILVTDKTGTLTEGRITFTGSLDSAGRNDDGPRRFALLALDTGRAAGSVTDSLDQALLASGTPDAGYPRLAAAPFDHDRRMASVLVAAPDGSTLIVTKGAPEAVLAASRDVPPRAVATLDALFAEGSRVLAVATRAVPPGTTTLGPADEHDMVLVGFLVFHDPPKPEAAESLGRLAALGVQVKIATGDNPLVARKLCADLGMPADRILTGREIDRLDDRQLRSQVGDVAVFARVSPGQKARIVRALRQDGRAVGFLGDGVNDALALHDADIGISVDTGTDVAKDAADVVLLDKSLDVLADGVGEGRRIFANTVKYVLMGTASNFGNVFSAAAASALLPFLPLLPSQILLNNLLYDSSQLAIPTDRVDPEQLAAPSHWDISLIRRFMLFFGPVSSLFDFMTFGILLGAFHTGPALFRSGWFVESLATQTLVVFAVRTGRVPFFRSRASMPLTVAALTVVAIGVALPISPLAGLLGFTPLPLPFYLAFAVLVVAYLALVEFGKTRFATPPHTTESERRRGTIDRVERRAARFSTDHFRPREEPIR